MSDSYIGLDEWWESEPFGYDHPDTYQGIRAVIDLNTKPLHQQISQLEEALLKADKILSASLDVIKGGFFTKDQIELARKTRDEIKEILNNV